MGLEDNSRCHTIISSLKRLDLIDFPDVLTLHIVGADPQEQSQIVQKFSPLFQIIHGRVRVLNLLLVGPNLAQLDAIHVFVNNKGDPSLTVNIQFVVDLYSCESISVYNRPHAIFMFQAGVWAYPTWKDSIRFARNIALLGIIITAYNLEESEDDEEQLLQWGYSDKDWLWTPEYNPSCSSIAVASPDIQGQILIENQYWQALSPIVPNAA